MNEFLPRTGPVAPVTPPAERGVAAVRPLAAVTAASAGNEGKATLNVAGGERATAASAYARIQADIADVLARIRPSTPPASEAVEQADHAITALMPDPVIMLPMPPTEPDIVAFVAQVAQSVATQAAQTRAAQAHSTPLIAEAAHG